MAMEQILELLQDDAQLTPSQLAVMLGESEEAVAKAIAQYEREGVIRGYHALVNWERTETQKASALIELRITPKKDTGFDEIAGRIMNFPEVESVYLMSGGYDLMVILEGKTLREVSSFVSDKLSTLDTVLSTATHFILKKYKDHGTVLSQIKEDEREKITP